MAPVRALLHRHAARRQATQHAIATRYCISLLPATPRTASSTVVPWQSKQALHGVLASAFRQDDAHTRTNPRVPTRTILRPIARNLLKQERTATCGLNAKRLKVGWNGDYLLKVLAPTLPI